MSLNSGKKPLIVFTLIVKNEEHCILRCLESCYEMYLEEEVEMALAVVDTGSTDNTIQVIRDWIKAKGIRGSVISRPWLRFDGSRNESFCYAEYVAGCILSKKKFEETKSIFLNGDDMAKMGVNGIRNLGLDFASYERFNFPKNLFVKNRAYILNMDADNYLMHWDEAIQDMVVKRSFEEKFKLDSYDVTIEEGNNCFNRGLMYRINNKKKFRWKYMIHESCQTKAAKVKNGQITEYRLISTHEGGRALDKNKYLRDALLCEEGILESTELNDKSRYTFYAAQSYACFGHNQTAIEYYKKRLEFDTYDEEKYIACYRMSSLTADVSEKIKYLEKAMVICPFRYEAAYHLMRHYEEQGFPAVAYERFRYLIYHSHKGFLFNENDIIYGHFLMKIGLIAESVRKTYWQNTYRYLEVLYDQKYAMLRLVHDKLTLKYSPSNIEYAENNIKLFDAEIDKVEKEQLERKGKLPPKPWDKNNLN